jgi:hypothetical protein
MEQQRPLRTISDDDLLDRLTRLTRDSRRTEADLVAHMAEVDERKLYARHACASMFSYCVEVLHFSEAEAYLRIIAARASRKHPILLTLLAEGRLHLSGIGLLAPHLTKQNRDVVLARASHRSKREIQELVAELSPRPDVAPLMRKLPPMGPRRAEESTQPQPMPREEDRLRPDEVVASSAPASSAPRPVIEPLAPARYKVQFTATAALPRQASAAPGAHERPGPRWGSG